MKTWTAGILIFNDVELLDFAGPYEVLAAARVPPDDGFAGWRDAHAPFKVLTVAGTKSLVKATGGLGIQPDHGFDDHPPLDILIVPGGFGVRAIIDGPDHDATLDWVKRTAANSMITASVCTGAWVLARAGLLRNRRATTHFLCLDRLNQLDPTITVTGKQRIVDEGAVMTAGGVSAGLDMALHIVDRLCGQDAAAATSRYIEYSPVKTA